MKSPFLNILKKEFISFSRDRVGMVAILIVPMFALMLFNQVISTDMDHVNVMAVMQKPSDRANQFLQPLRENSIFNFMGTLSSVEEGMRYFKQDKIHALVVIGDNFDQHVDAPMAVTTKGDEKPAVQIITDNANTVIGTTASFYIQSALNPQHMDVISLKMLYNPGLYSYFQFGVGVFALFIIIQSVFACSSAMVKEKERHSIDAIIMSPVSTWQLMLGKLVTNFIINCIVSAIALFLVHYIIGLPVRGSLFLFAFITMLCIIITMLLASFISLSSATEANALSTSITVVCLPLMYLSGTIFPTDSLPEWACTASNFIYAKWYIVAARKVMLQGVDFTFVVKEVIFMLINLFIFLTLCIYKLKDDRWLR